MGHGDRAGVSRFRNCSVARTLDIIEDGWTFLILREVFFGVHRFERFRRNLEIPRATLAERLKRLVEGGLLKRTVYGRSGKRFEYHFTRKGVELYPVMLALLKWGDDWLLGPRESPPLALFHRKCGHWTRCRIVCSECGEEVDIREVAYRDGPGAGWDAEPARTRNRRSGKPLGVRLNRGCSVGRSLDIIGDRWTFMVMRETFFGVRRYDAFQRNLGVATNMLSNRLQVLVDNGLLRRQVYREKPLRHEYRQTPMGADLYGAYLTMIAWGDRWLAGERGPPLVLTHKRCGKDFTAEVVCGVCNERLNAWEVGGMGF